MAFDWAFSSLDALLGVGHRRRLHLDHQRTASRTGARRRQGRQACAVREAAGADQRRRARDGRGLPQGRRRAGTNHHLRNAGVASGDARGDRGRADRHADRGARLPCRLPAGASAGLAAVARPEAGGGVVLDITVHDADTLRFVLGDDPVEVTALHPVGRHGRQWARGRRHGRLALQVRRASPSSTTPSPPKYAGTGFEVHGTEGSLIAQT